MAQAQNTDADRKAALRRVAIVLSTLPTPLAARLLGTVEPAQKKSLRETMATLVDVDPLEKKRALQAFRTSLTAPSSRDSHPLSSVGTEPANASVADLGSASESIPGPGSRVVPAAAVPQDRIHVNDQQTSAKVSALAFLGDVDDVTLIRSLHGEHPQTIAVVLASIAPHQAARLLPKLSPALQSETLGRIGRLAGVPDDVAREIADHLRQRIRDTEPEATAGSAALSAILAAMPPSTAPAEQVPRSPESRSDAQPNHSAATTNDGGYPPSDLGRQRAHPTDESEAGLSAESQTQRLKLIAESISEAEEPASAAVAEPKEAESVAQESPAESLAKRPSTDAIHDHLVRLAPADLCAALGRVETRQAMLALCGLPNEIADAVMAVLPRGHARQVRRAMASLESIQLREIDEAKEAVANASNMDSMTVAADEIAAEMAA